MRWFCELLPLCFIRWYAKRYGERFILGDEVVTDPRPDIFVRICKCDELRRRRKK